MRRLLALLPLFGLAFLSSGCAMCCAPFDCDYPYVGGRWVRNNPTSGRVGSMFDEAGTRVDAMPASTAQETQATPTLAQPPMPQAGPSTRSVIPRNLGDSYLP